MIDFNRPGLAIFDKDHTLVKPVMAGQVFVDAPWDQKPVSNDIYLAVQALAKKDWMIAVTSNQGGIHAGHKTLDETFLEFRFLHEMYDCRINDSYFCPDGGATCWHVRYLCKPEDRALFTNSNPFLPPDANNFRKPEAGMLQLAIAHYQEFNPDGQVFYVGDRPEDHAAALKADIQFYWVTDFLALLLKSISLIQ